MLLAFERSAASERFVSLAIFLIGVRAFECARNLSLQLWCIHGERVS
jgi:hypothetical protein